MDLEFNGQIKSVKEWSQEIGLSESTIKRRYKKGWGTEKILTTPALSKNQHSKTFKIIEPAKFIKPAEIIESTEIKVIQRKVESITWKQDVFKVTIIDSDKKKIVSGFVNDIWGVYERPYGKCALIHIPTGKRVGRNTLKIRDLKELAEILTPMFPAGVLPEDVTKLSKIVRTVDQFFKKREKN